MKKSVMLILALILALCFSVAASAESAPSDTPNNAGEQSSETTKPTRTSLPVITFDQKPTNQPVTVQITLTEGSGLLEGDVIRWRIYDPVVTNADLDPAIIWQDYTEPFTVDRNTMLETRIFYPEGGGSASVKQEITCIDTVPPTAPELSVSPADWTKGPVAVSVSGGSDEQSGLARLEYRTGDGAWTEYTGPVNLTAASRFSARSVDLAGNCSEPVTREINNFDLTAPDVTRMTVSLSASGNPVIADFGAFSKYFGSGVTVTIDGAADNESGVAKVQYQLLGASDPVSEDKWLDYDPAKKPVIASDFCGYVFARACDKVGNCSASVVSEGFIVDCTAPVIDKVTLSETAVTGSRVIVTFSVKDNFWLETVTVNDAYAGIYYSSFTAFRNGDYEIVARDKVGNEARKTVTITNINATPFTLLDTWKGMNSQDFTPASWQPAQTAATELETLLTIQASQPQIEAAAQKLLTTMEALVARGDGTLSRELISRLREYDTALYTDSSWANVEAGIVQLESCLENPECTQEAVDTDRRALEAAVSALVKRGDFTDLDRLIAQAERQDTDMYSTESHNRFVAALEHAKSMSRTDSSQADIDAAYTELLNAMGGLELFEKKHFDITPVILVVLGILVLAAAVALFIVRLRMSNGGKTEADEDVEPSELDGEEEIREVGDICFSDEEDDAPQTVSEPKQSGSSGSTYIGGRR